MPLEGYRSFQFSQQHQIHSISIHYHATTFFNTSCIDLKRIVKGLGVEICLDFTLLLGFLHLIYVFLSMIEAVVTECLITVHLEALWTGDMIENSQDMLFMHKNIYSHNKIS